MHMQGLLFASILCVAGCASDEVALSDARQPKKINASVIRLADRDYLVVGANRWRYSYGQDSRWQVVIAAKSDPKYIDGRWRAELGEIDEAKPHAPYMAMVKVHRDRIATYLPWNNESSVIDRSDGHMVQRDIGKRLFDRSAGKAETLVIQFWEQTSSDFTTSDRLDTTQPANQ